LFVPIAMGRPAFATLRGIRVPVSSGGVSFDAADSDYRRRMKRFAPEDGPPLVQAISAPEVALRVLAELLDRKNSGSGATVMIHAGQHLCAPPPSP